MSTFNEFSTLPSEVPRLTARQAQILELIQRAISRTGAPPTRAEIAAEMGFRSPNAAEEHLKALAKKGVIELVSRQPNPGARAHRAHLPGREQPVFTNA